MGSQVLERIAPLRAATCREYAPMSLSHSPRFPLLVSASASRACARGLAVAFAASVVVLAAGADAHAGALGGGLIEFLFTGKSEPMLQASLSPTVDPEILRYQEDPRYQGPAPSSSTRRSACFTSSSWTARRSATASASAAPGSPGPASRLSP
jgi:hypothetical protein